MSIKVYPYKMGSEGAKLLAGELGKLVGRKVFRVKPGYKMRPRDTIINWGYGAEIPLNQPWPQIPVRQLPRLINDPLKVNTCRNKLTFFTAMSGKVNIPEWTVDKEVAKQWAADGKTKIYCRQSLNGQGGAGIVVAEKAEDVVNAPLYTKRVKNSREYRVHIFKDRAIQVLEKRHPKEGEYNEVIRNEAGGWRFFHPLVFVPQCVIDEAIKAVAVAGIDFGGVDVVYSKKQDKAFVLEVNTAPGLGNETASLYAKAIHDFVMAKRA